MGLRGFSDGSDGSDFSDPSDPADPSDPGGAFFQSGGAIGPSFFDGAPPR